VRVEQLADLRCRNQSSHSDRVFQITRDSGEVQGSVHLP